jgi:hypothetical protein
MAVLPLSSSIVFSCLFLCKATAYCVSKQITTYFTAFPETLAE